MVTVLMAFLAGLVIGGVVFFGVGGRMARKDDKPATENDILRLSATVKSEAAITRECIDTVLASVCSIDQKQDAKTALVKAAVKRSKRKC